MIKMLTARTRISDDARTAVAEILGQLDLENRLLKNAVGILVFHPDFLLSNTVKAINDALPFDTIGGTTAAEAVDGDLGDRMLAVSVLTSDTIVFRSGVSRSVDDDAESPVAELYARVAPPEMGRPSLLLTVGPIIDNAGGDDFVAAFDAASGGVPLFGSLAFTHRQDLVGIETYANGRRYTDAITLVALFGDVDPHFYITTLPEENGVHERAVITQAEKNRIQRINGFLPIYYLEKIGLAAKGRVSSDIITYPFVLTLKDGSQVARAAYKVADDGSILCYGSVIKGARVCFSEIGADYVVESTGKTIAHAFAESTDRGALSALIVSCISRCWVLGKEADLEMKEIAMRLDAAFAYQFMYSGGEICPVKNGEGQWVNRFHNFSMIACVL
ncbi:MAG: FIST C-terminal domain-containing protein [Candidatus Accumulibacter sp.]|jgi:hypothetical protein|nr:FIST C-terminal domain-containing protein [Accumulibacter sp.]